MVASKRVECDIDDPEDYITKNLKVLTKADKSGASGICPFVFWPSQRDYLHKRTFRDIILKSRQTGMTTGVMALNAHKLFTVPYQRGVVITHDDDTSQFLLMTMTRFWQHLDAELKPRVDWKSSRRIRFPDLDSYIYVDSANSDSIGIGQSLTFAHLSEVARWPKAKADQLFADVSQTTPAQGAHVVIESTPRGRVGLFPELWQAAKKKEVPYKPFFYPWWFDITAVFPVEGKLEYTSEEKKLVDYVKRKDNIDLTPEQIAFRRLKQQELRDLFYQEYPENDIDCFLTNEMAAFDGVALKDYMMGVWDGRQIDDWTTIWRDVLGGERYVIGVDMASGQAKGDWSVACVINIKRNEYVARIRAKIPPDLFAGKVMALGYRYNQALIGVEKASHGHSVLQKLLDNAYPNIYFHEDYDSMVNGTSQPGWKTTAKTKPIMVDTMAAFIRSHSIELWSQNFCEEAMDLTWDGSKIVKRAKGSDDEVDALMIALQLREAQPIMEQFNYAKPKSYIRV